MSLLFRHAAKEIVILKGGNTYDQFNFPGFFNAISSIELVLQAKDTAEFHVQVNPAYDDGVKALRIGMLSTFTDKAIALERDSSIKNAKDIDPELAELPASSDTSGIISKNMPTIAIKLYWPDETLNDGRSAETNWYVGQLFSPKVNIDGATGEFSFELVGKAFAHRLTGIYGNKVYNAQPAKDVIKDLFPNLSVYALDAQTATRLNEKMTVIANGSVLDIVKNILIELDCYWFMRESSLYVQMRESIEHSQALYQFVMRRQIDPSRNIFPIFNYSCDSLSLLFISGFSSGVVTKSYSTDTKETNTTSFTKTANADMKSAISDQEKKNNPGVGTMAHPSREETKNLNPVEGQTADPKEQSENRIHTAVSDSNNKFIEASIQTMGIPDIKPFVIVDIRMSDDSEAEGLPGISGRAMVKKVTHRWDSESWTTELQVNMAADIGSVGFPNVKEFDPDSSGASILEKEALSID